jgi:DNA repair protein RecN (Recombination protein N)
LFVRRIISSKDRHRIYINGRAATIQLLKTVTLNLVGIASQHAHQGLLQEDQQLHMLDQFAGLQPLRGTLASQYHQLLPLIQHLKLLESRKMQQNERKALLEFQKKEITEAALEPDEDVRLEKKRFRLKNAETLQQHLSQSVNALYSADGAILERLIDTQKIIEKAAELDDALTKVSQQMADAIYRLEDMAHELQSRFDGAAMDPKALESIEDRLYLIHRLKKKYGGSLASVFDYLDRIEEELSGVERIDDEIAEASSQIETLQTQLQELARDLSVKRMRAAREMRTRVIAELAQLKMPKTEFQVSFESKSMAPDSLPEIAIDGKIIGETGIDNISFLIAPNVGEPPKPLKSIASGGELSRVVLALKIILAETDAVETVIFDEVDAGIGGGVAETIGQKLSMLAKYHQVLCITHLPQIAKFGGHHFKIEKIVANGRTHTTIAPLNEKHRLQEIARMLGGVKITTATLNHARDLLQNN